MTCRAILWCGFVSRPAGKGRLDRATAVQGAFPDCDFPASVNDLEIAYRAAKALGARAADIYPHVCDPDLLPPALVARWSPPTKEALARTLKGIRREASSGDRLLFIATNHGTRDGLLTMVEVDEFEDAPTSPFLTPEDLSRSLDSVQGDHTVVIASCHAGIFLPLGDHPNRTVLAACGADVVYRIHREERSCSPFLVELFASWCGVSLWDDVPTSNLPLPEALARATARLASTYQTHAPLHRGALR